MVFTACTHAATGTIHLHSPVAVAWWATISRGPPLTLWNPWLSHGEKCCRCCPLTYFASFKIHSDKAVAVMYYTNTHAAQCLRKKKKINYRFTGILKYPCAYAYFFKVK